MEEKPIEKRPSGLNRRRFIGALGATAAAGVFLQRGQDANAQSQTYYYQDSFGNVVPAGQGVIDLGIYPPPVSGTPGASPDDVNPDTSSTTFNSGYPKYNILLIVVDQMRNPEFWLPSGNNWLSSYANILPNLTNLASHSFVFHNYFVAATVCTPSRACMLTGLYSQQTCVFKTSNGGTVTPPPLLPYNANWSPGNSAGFPTIGNVLSQQLNLPNANNAYQCTWIGKWHLSCGSGALDGIPGENGPSDYGFNSNYNLPTTSNSNPYLGGSVSHRGYPSPDGALNGGTGGDFLDSFTQGNNNSAHDVPNWAATLQYNNNGNMQYVMPYNNTVELNDAAIAWAFTNYWLPNANNTLNNGNNATTGRINTPWFCAVSLINPHDIADFPWPFNLTANNNSVFPPPSNPTTVGYQPPPVSSNNNYTGNACYGNSCATDGDVTTIMALPSLYSSLPPGTGNNAGPWNWENQATAGKPGLQLAFQRYCDNQGGSIQAPSYNANTNSWNNSTGWTTFLNYYAWLQSNVDYQIGQILGTNPSSNNGSSAGLLQSPFNNSTVVVFTSDHGDYGGSHGIHAKGGGLYDEALNVPFFISFPQQRSSNNSSPVPLSYVCSSVDLLPLLYAMALGNESWRTNANDMIYYLAGREAIQDAIYQYDHNNNNIVQQRRISAIPLYTPPYGCNVNNSNCGAWELYQPFVLHTTDEWSAAPLSANANYQPCHAIAFRTVDQTEVTTVAAPFFGQNSFGGGKLGIYSFWDTCDAVGNNNVPPIKGMNANAQYEFYNYSPHLGNANPQEVGNQYLSGGNISSLAQPYYNDFFPTGNNTPGMNIQNELYVLNANGSTGNSVLQVQAASNTALANYLHYLECTQGMTGSNGLPSNCSSNNNNGCSSPTVYSS